MQNKTRKQINLTFGRHILKQGATVGPNGILSPASNGGVAFILSGDNIPNIIKKLFQIY